jgi:hypothetical protein
MTWGRNTRAHQCSWMDDRDWEIVLKIGENQEGVMHDSIQEAEWSFQGRSLILWAWYPYKRRRDTGSVTFACTEKTPVKTWKEGVTCKPQKEGWWHLISDFQLPELWENTGLLYFVIAPEQTHTPSWGTYTSAPSTQYSANMNSRTAHRLALRPWVFLCTWPTGSIVHLPKILALYWLWRSRDQYATLFFHCPWEVRLSFPRNREEKPDWRGT